MAKKEVYLADIGTILLQKRRGSRNLRLSVNAQGRVRVSQPIWTPFSAGIAFARNHQAWIKEHLSASQIEPVKNGALIGKSHRVVFTKIDGEPVTIKCRLYPSELRIASNLEISHPDVQKKVVTTAEKALRMQSKNLLPLRLEDLAGKYQFKYRDVKIKKLSSRWGSCSDKDDISLSLYLIQLPWHLIDYVLLHELVHTVHKHHRANFWEALEQVQPGAKKLRRELHSWQPRLLPTD